MERGTSRLARVISDRIKTNGTANSSLVLDFGVIQSDYSLLTNTYPIPIPKSDYLVLRQLTLGAEGDTLIRTESSDGHRHNVPISEKMRWLMPDDRVLVAWVQNDAVVLDIICPANDVG